MANEESWYTKWLRNGRLSGLVFFILFAAQITCTVLKIPTSTWDPLVLLAGGGFIGNLALRKESDEKATRERLAELEKKVDDNESP